MTTVQKNEEGKEKDTRGDKISEQPWTTESFKNPTNKTEIGEGGDAKCGYSRRRPAIYIENGLRFLTEGLVFSTFCLSVCVWECSVFIPALRHSTLFETRKASTRNYRHIGTLTSPLTPFLVVFCFLYFQQCYTHIE